MKRFALLGMLALLACALTVAWGQYSSPTGRFIDVEPKGKDVTSYIDCCRKLKGRLIDHTVNHGKDNRIWSRAMHQWRDMYIYLPPGYDPNEQYPIMLFLHPFTMDEKFFMSVVPLIDEAIVSGKMPPLIVAAPDGSLDGFGSLHKPGSFFLNSGSGNYEDFLLQDVWDFVTHRYPIRSERGAHILCGASMGGYSAFNLGLRYRQCFGAVIGIHPPLNMRWADVDGNPRAKFDPRRWGWRTGFDNPHEVVANYYGAFKIKLANYIHPAFGVGDEALINIACNNPLELLVNTRYKNGELAMFVGYAGRDEFNVDAQVDSFLYYCKFKGIGVAVAFEPDGRHDTHTALKLFAPAFAWLGPQLAPYAPGYSGPVPPAPVQFRFPEPGVGRFTPPLEQARRFAPGDMTPRDPGSAPPTSSTWPMLRVTGATQPSVNPPAPTRLPSASEARPPLRWPGIRD